MVGRAIDAVVFEVRRKIAASRRKWLLPRQNGLPAVALVPEPPASHFRRLHEPPRGCAFDQEALGKRLAARAARGHRPVREQEARPRGASSTQHLAFDLVAHAKRDDRFG
jgi:hypothetical protein